MRLLHLFVGLIVSFGCTAQFRVTSLPKSNLPASVRYVGQLTQAVRWTDGGGEHLLLLTTTGPAKNKHGEDDAQDAGLAAQHYRLQAGRYQQTWQVQDYVKECPLDITARFIDKAFAVTDLNKDGRAEVWLLYQTACRGDVSPAALKLIMYENDKKYAARGETQVKISASDYAGGNYTFDDAFRRGPALFRQYANKLWQQHKRETGD